MSVAESIANRVKHMRKGKPFTKALFAEEGSRTSVNKALSRMTRSGLLERVARGIYMRPKISEYTGRDVRANPITVMETVAKASGETIQIHGVEAGRFQRLSATPGFIELRMGSHDAEPSSALSSRLGIGHQNAGAAEYSVHTQWHPAAPGYAQTSRCPWAGTA